MAEANLESRAVDTFKCQKVGLLTISHDHNHAMERRVGHECRSKIHPRTNEPQNAGIMTHLTHSNIMSNRIERVLRAVRARRMDEDGWLLCSWYETYGGTDRQWKPALTVCRHDIQTDRQTNKQTYKHRYKHTNRQTDRQTDRI
jgi:hypothetical protein